MNRKRRIALWFAAAAVVVALMGGVLWWNHPFRREAAKWDERLVEAEERGFWTGGDPLPTEPIPDEGDNLAPLVSALSKRADAPGDLYAGSRQAGLVEPRPLSPLPPELLEELTNRSAYYIERDWSDVTTVTFPELAGIKAAINVLLRISADLAKAGDTIGAIEHFRAAANIVRNFDGEETPLTGLVHVAIWSVLIHKAVDIVEAAYPNPALTRALTEELSIAGPDFDLSNYIRLDAAFIVALHDGGSKIEDFAMTDDQPAASPVDAVYQWWLRLNDPERPHTGAWAEEGYASAMLERLIEVDNVLEATDDPTERATRLRKLSESWASDPGRLRAEDSIAGPGYEHFIDAFTRSANHYRATLDLLELVEQTPPGEEFPVGLKLPEDSSDGLGYWSNGRDVVIWFGEVQVSLSIEQALGEMTRQSVDFIRSGDRSTELPPAFERILRETQFWGQLKK